MNKKRKTGIILIVAPFTLIIISFIGTLISNFVLEAQSNIFNLIFGLIGLLGVIGMILFPFLLVVGIILIVKNKDSQPEETLPEEQGTYQDNIASNQVPPE